MPLTSQTAVYTMSCLCTCAGGSADHPHMPTQAVVTVSHSFHNVYLTQPNSLINNLLVLYATQTLSFQF